MLASEILCFRNDYVLIKRIPMPTQTKSGIILPTKAVELPQLGHIVAIGWKNPDNLKIGDLILLPKFGGLLYDFDGIDYYVYHARELLAAINP